MVGIVATLFAFAKVRPASMGITRIVGTPYIVDDDTVRNQYLVRLVNKQPRDVSFVVRAVDIGKAVQVGLEDPVLIPAMSEALRPLIVRLDRRDYEGRFHFKIECRDDKNSFELHREVEFLGPDAKMLRDDDDEHGKKHH